MDTKVTVDVDDRIVKNIIKEVIKMIIKDKEIRREINDLLYEVNNVKRPK